MKWFGESWGAPITRHTPHMETPVGRECPQCSQRIEADDRGVVTDFIGGDTPDLAWHLVCFLINIGIAPQSIKSETEYRIAVCAIARLMALDPRADSLEGAQLGELATVVETYEREHYPI